MLTACLFFVFELHKQVLLYIHNVMMLYDCESLLIKAQAPALAHAGRRPL